MPRWGRRATTDARTSYIETGNRRTSYGKIFLLRGVDTINDTINALKNLLIAGVSTSSARGLSTGHAHLSTSFEFYGPQVMQ